MAHDISGRGRYTRNVPTREREKERRIGAFTQANQSNRPFDRQLPLDLAGSFPEMTAHLASARLWRRARQLNPTVGRLD